MDQATHAKYLAAQVEKLENVLRNYEENYSKIKNSYKMLYDIFRAHNISDDVRFPSPEQLENFQRNPSLGKGAIQLDTFTTSSTSEECKAAFLGPSFFDMIFEEKINIDQFSDTENDENKFTELDKFTTERFPYADNQKANDNQFVNSQFSIPLEMNRNERYFPGSYPNCSNHLFSGAPLGAPTITSNHPVNSYAAPVTLPTYTAIPQYPVSLYNEQHSANYNPYQADKSYSNTDHLKRNPLWT
mmetsp:Transcript_28241/g.38878  ORF Transcript_28241/g.38878 Transcript_28241/m.38878 type:complete len:244 (+) Transcript_28241:29-760(+)|eukprot:CAMPEP_0170099660 /NCGR_PEP_ID=MMETSP0020_2-20130122/1170_1 /TAXON_ID=98059 /ORGANISM="Dinobryon sp., Strain UTEXLB2267" /LENGTH=243 /DNA_ID=CAMNT_0010322357 /DNA_START=33 /DNA_END=764 /DNA_ORIENTATION=+